MPRKVYLQRPSDAEAREHAEKKARQRSVRNKILANKTERKGLLLVMTGTGKGKTTAAIGLVIRALGQQKRVAVIQFVKGAWQCGERNLLQQLQQQGVQDRLHLMAMGDGFSWDTQDLQRDWDAARAAWQHAKDCITGSNYDLIVLDEINIVLRAGLLDVDEVIAVFQARRSDLHIVATGRNADPKLIAVADSVTEMVATKHHFRAGIMAQTGIEY